jgi:two-component system chemotaxis response regulator CheY
MSLELRDLVVVLVEPSATQRKIICHYLDELAISQVSYQSNGSEALKYIEASVPDLVISSLYLPDLSGTELLLAIRDNERLNDTAFILISSETRLRYLDPVRQSGATAILSKPFDLEELKLALGATIEQLSSQQLQLQDFEPENLQVMIVDDSALARRYIRRTLENMGICHFTEAKDGTEATALIVDNFYDLIVTDYNMPQMDGKELIEHIRTASSQSSIPILMVTSEEDEKRLAAVQQAGVSAICDKPFDAGNVRGLLQTLLNYA